MLSTDEWNEFLSLENFALAWRRIRNSERIENKDRLGLNVFSMNTDLHLEWLIDLIRTNEYVPVQPNRLFFPKKAGTLRPFPLLSMNDRLVYQAIGNIVIKNSYRDLMDFADRRVFAHIPQQPTSDFTLMSGKSRRNQKGQFEKFKDAVINARERNQHGWIVKTDIAGFYPSIEHHSLIHILKSKGWLNEPRICSLLAECLKQWAIFDRDLPLQRGVPMGYETSDILATLYLLEVDEKMLSYCELLRYVDDMYLFAPNRAFARYALIQLDRLVQGRALILQTAKTEFEEFSNSEIDDQYRIELELREKLSDISLDLDGPPEDEERAQQQLLNLFWEICNRDISNSVAIALETYLKFDATLAFILYRLKITSSQIRDIALLLLENLPWRSLHITKYLSNFANDVTVIDRLLQIAEDPCAYDSVRVNCMEALATICSDSAKIRNLAKAWCVGNESWHLKLTGVSILQKYPEEYPLLRKISREEVDETTRALAISACFNLVQSERDKKSLIQQALSDPSDFIKTLGIYLWRREAIFNRDEIEAPLSNFLQSLLEAPEISDTGDEIVYIRELIKDVFGFSINPQLPLAQIFPDLGEIRQLLLNLRDTQETNSNEFVRALISFSRILTQVLTQSSDLLFAFDYLGEIDQEIGSSMAQLTLAEQKLSATRSNPSVLSGFSAPVVRITLARRMKDDLSVVFAKTFLEVHKQYDSAPPQNLVLKASLLHKSIAPNSLIFISYKAEDRTEAEKVWSTLKGNDIQAWIATRDIEIGKRWDDVIFDEALPNAWGLVLIATPEAMDSQNVKDEIDYAVTKGLLLVVFVLRECYLRRVERYQRINATNDFDAATQELVSFLVGKQPARE